MQASVEGVLPNAWGLETTRSTLPLPLPRAKGLSQPARPGRPGRGRPPGGSRQPGRGALHGPEAALGITRGGLSVSDRSGILLMHVEDRDSLERLQQVARQRCNTPAWIRVPAIVLAKQGDTAVRIAHCLGCSHRAVQIWVAAYNGGGLETLRSP
jgi:Homeodomain-like domain